MHKSSAANSEIYRSNYKCSLMMWQCPWTIVSNVMTCNRKRVCLCVVRLLCKEDCSCFVCQFWLSSWFWLTDLSTMHSRLCFCMLTISLAWQMLHMHLNLVDTNVSICKHASIFCKECHLIFSYQCFYPNITLFTPVEVRNLVFDIPCLGHSDQSNCSIRRR